jgi:hypothetical protein
VEAAYDEDDEHGVERLLEALFWLTEEVKKRKVHDNARPRRRARLRKN